ncbi:uncharacterized protein LOC108914620 [Anoplophora glabripennis]|uniref:uncharacterized protein LOC108914620 n=1 Tax=Anoplophora glabripennis TaxID=217634 RepID=UPI0008750B1F|nr:uncharacterized protein LOC108914620 [Anoplophora glabripennis]
MKIKIILLVNVFLLILTFFATTRGQVMDTSRHVVSRQKRWLIWNEGTNWVQFIFGVGIPLEVNNQAITIGTVMKAFYLLPTNSSSYTSPSINYERKKRSESRWFLYDVLENYLSRYKSLDGKACLLKTICEVSQIPFDEKSGILAEVLHAVLTPSSTEDVSENDTDSEYHAAEKLGKEVANCNSVFPECGTNLLQQFTKLLTG